MANNKARRRYLFDILVYVLGCLFGQLCLSCVKQKEKPGVRSQGGRAARPDPCKRAQRWLLGF